MLNRNKFKTREEYNQWYREYREKNKEKIRAYNKEYNKLWRRKNGYHNEEKWRKNNRLKVNVEQMLIRAIKRGEIKRMPCMICGKEKTHAHHPDYVKPLEVIFLCSLHHKEIHRKFSKK